MTSPRPRARSPLLAATLAALALGVGAAETWQRGRDLDAAPRSDWARRGVELLAVQLRGQPVLHLLSDLPPARVRPRQFGLQSVLPPAVVRSLADPQAALERLAAGEAVLVDGDGRAAARALADQLRTAAADQGLVLVLHGADQAPLRGRALILVVPAS